jgi:sirohydrochlorin ferrochelatase
MENVLRYLFPSWMWIVPCLVVVGLSFLAWMIEFSYGQGGFQVLALAAGGLQAQEPGFLLIAPDRGFLGNKEVREVYDTFRKDYRGRLVFITLAEDYEEAVRQRFALALAELQEEGAKTIAVLPLILSDADPHLKKARRLLATLNPSLPFAPPLAKDYLAAQILEDRAKALSQAPAKERLVVVGFGATRSEEAEAIGQDLERLLREVKERLPFQGTTVAVLFHPAAEEAVLREGNGKAEDAIRTAASSPLRTVVVPFHLGLKHTRSMELGRKIEGIVQGLPIAYDGREILPHANVALWLKKMANRWIKPAREEIGVVIMPHGAGEYVNEPILKAIEPLQRRYNLEVAFGMADVDTLQEAIDKIESRGARRILVLRLYNVSLSLKEETEYVLGLSNSRPAIGHYGGHGNADRLPRVRTGALLSTIGGFDGDPLIAEVLYERVMEVSQAPEQETVILLAHGDGDEDKDRFWHKQMEAEAQYIKAKSANRFQAIHVATLREDWPDKREKVVTDLRELIAKTSRGGGRVLVISNRVAGAGPYRKYLRSLDYVLNDKGIAPHPNLTRWLEKEIKAWIASLR